MSEYAIEFRILALSSEWNDKALWDHFLNGLAERIKDEIYSLKLPTALDGLVEAVANWPTPGNRRAVQCFLGFANFYRRFIRGFSQIALPLTNLTSTLRRFAWSEQAHLAFDRLKNFFVSAPIFCNPDPSRQFIVEVDASEAGVGAILSQRAASDNKVHPCAFLSLRLTPSERDYDIGNKELLAVKLALEEWRHWLEGSRVPFLVWTDHKNLEYIRSVKRSNSRQARWALFFGRFHFNISYRPGSKNSNDCPEALLFVLRGSPVGTLLRAGRPPWSGSHSCASQAAVLVAICGAGHS